MASAIEIASWTRRGFCISLLAMATVGIGSLVVPADASAAIPSKPYYSVDYSRSYRSGWNYGGTFNSYGDALRAANRYKFKGYAVRINREPRGGSSVVPPMTGSPKRRHGPGF